MPNLYAVTTTAYLSFDPGTGTWLNAGTPPTTTSSRLRFFGTQFTEDILMFHLTGNGDDNGNGALRRTVDAGVTWVTLDLPGGFQIVDYDVSPIGILWVITSNGRVFNSFDLGDTWEDQVIAFSITSGYRAIKCSLFSESVAILRQASIANPRLYYTRDGGTTWTQEAPFGHGLNSASDWTHHLMFPTDEEDVLLATGYDEGNYGRFIDFSLHFTTSLGGAGATASNVYAMTQGGLGGTIFALVSSPNRILRSKDLGITWESFTIPVNIGTISGSNQAKGIMFGPEEGAGYVLGSNNPNIWQVEEMEDGDLSDASLWTAMPDPGTMNGPSDVALLDEGVFTTQPDDDRPVLPPYSGTPPTKPDPNGGTGMVPGSGIFDRCVGENGDGGEVWADGMPPMVVSLVDRVPPGKYILVRQANYTYANIVQSAKSMGMRGIIFLLGDTEDPAVDEYPGGPGVPEPYRSHALKWQPDPDGRPWQVHQYSLEQDQLEPESDGRLDVPNCGFAGPQRIRSRELIVAGAFICGQAAWDRPAQAAAMIATTRNRLNLDFVLIDIDVRLPDDSGPVWNQPTSDTKVTTLAAHVQQRFTRSPRSPQQFELSSHFPVFFVLPASPFSGNTQLYPNLLSRPTSPATTTTTLDRGNLFPPFQNEYTGPVTFACPRIPATGTQSDLRQGWQWAKPMRSTTQYIGLTHSAFMFDIRNGGDPSGMVNQVATDGGLSVQFHGSSKNWTPQSGMVVYDDFDAAMTGSTGGKYPIDWWDMDMVDVYGAYVPAMHPDPPPIAITGEEYACWVDSRGRTISAEEAEGLNDSEAGSAQLRRLTLWWENWKVGHLSNKLGIRSSNFLPNWMQIVEKYCGTESITRKAIPSWIKINGKWAVPIKIDANDDVGMYRIMVDQYANKIVFAGKPCDGDEGIYALDIGGARRVGRAPATTVPLVITVVRPETIDDGGDEWSTGIRSPLPDIGPVKPNEDYKDSSYLHPHLPKIHLPEIGQAVHNDAFPSDFCAGATYPLPPKDGVAGEPGECPFDESLCGAPFTGDLIVAADEWCRNNGLQSAIPLICGVAGNRPLFLAFVQAMARALSNFNPNFESADGCQHGLFRIDNCIGLGVGYTRQQLLSPELNTMLALPALGEAFQDSYVGFNACGVGWRSGFDDAERLAHAVIAFMELSNLAPGVHGGDSNVRNSDYHEANPCQTSTGDSLTNQVIATVLATWQCYRDTFNAGEIPTPGREGGTGQPAPPGDGAGQPGPETPDSTYVPGCPLNGILTADCAWHWANEGIPAIDVNCTGENPIKAPCNGQLTTRAYISGNPTCIADTRGWRDGCQSPPYCTGLGIAVYIQCESGLQFRIGHLSADDLNDPSLPQPGDAVSTGQTVAHCGSPTTGCSTGPHIHLEVLSNGTRICPMEVLPAQCP